MIIYVYYNKSKNNFHYQLATFGIFLYFFKEENAKKALSQFATTPS